MTPVGVVEPAAVVVVGCLILGNSNFLSTPFSRWCKPVYETERLVGSEPSCGY